MLPFLVPLLTSLASSGMSMLAGAIEAKGKAVIEDKLGVTIPNNPANISPELMVKLKELEMEHEEFLLEAQIKKAEIEVKAEADASKEVTARWTADMASDNKLSKNVRPGIAIFLTAAMTLFALGSIWDLSIAEVYVTLFGQLLMLVYGAYFVGRTVEKGLDMQRKSK